VFLIEKNTPPTVKFNIFKRINTGGLPLSTQEIRHALHQGRVTRLLQELADSEEFKTATNHSIRDERMADRECVLRFLAFTIFPPADYKSPEFDGFLSEQMAEINTFADSQEEVLRDAFFRAMHAARRLFGRDAFRKPLRLYGRRMPLNKALFEAWSVNLGKLGSDDIERLVGRRELLEKRFIDLCTNQAFLAAISQGTGDPVKVRRRFEMIDEIIKGTLQ
jgi:hypothetical protein